jgi:hypothetical protein
LIRPDRRIDDFEERLDNLSRSHLQHRKIIRPNRFTRYDADLVSRREMYDYVADQIATSGVGSAYTMEVVVCSGTTGSITYTPTDATKVVAVLEVANIVMRRVAAAPGVNEFSVSGTTLTINAARSGATLKVSYPFEGGAFTIENLTATYPSYVATISHTPSSASKVVVLWQPANIALRYTAGAPDANEFTVSGTTLTLGRQLTADGQAVALYPYAI